MHRARFGSDWEGTRLHCGASRHSVDTQHLNVATGQKLCGLHHYLVYNSILFIYARLITWQLFPQPIFLPCRLGAGTESSNH
jgi:hypothetical protein